MAVLFVEVYSVQAKAGGIDHLVKVSGDGQVGTVASNTAAPHVIKVVDADLTPIAGITVFWTVVSGGGTVTQASSVTDLDGLASTYTHLGTVAGEPNIIRATVPGIHPVDYTSTPVADVPSTISIVEGDGQSVAAGHALPTPLKVRVKDRFGNNCPSVSVTWEALKGGGSIPSPTTTLADGTTTAVPTLGTSLGTNQFKAYPTATPSASVLFSATSIPGTPVSITKSGGINQVGFVDIPQKQPFEVFVADEFGNPCSFTTVTWSASWPTARVAPTESQTGIDGIAAAVGTPGTTETYENQQWTAAVAGVGFVTFSVHVLQPIHYEGSATDSLGMRAIGKAQLWRPPAPSERAKRQTSLLYDVPIDPQTKGLTARSFYAQRPGTADGQVGFTRDGLDRMVLFDPYSGNVLLSELPRGYDLLLRVDPVTSHTYEAAYAGSTLRKETWSSMDTGLPMKTIVYTQIENGTKEVRSVYDVDGVTVVAAAEVENLRDGQGRVVFSSFKRVL